MGAAQQIESPILGHGDAVRQFENELRLAGIDLVERGMAMLEEGRLNPTDPIEQRALRLARLQIATNATRGRLPAYMTGRGIEIYWIATAPSGRRTLTCGGRYIHSSPSDDDPREAEREMSRALLAHALSDETRRVQRDELPPALVDAWLVEHRERLARDGGHWSRKQIRAWAEEQSC